MIAMSQCSCAWDTSRRIEAYDERIGDATGFRGRFYGTPRIWEDHSQATLVDRVTDGARRRGRGQLHLSAPAGISLHHNAFLESCGGQRANELSTLRCATGALAHLYRVRAHAFVRASPGAGAEPRDR